MLVAFDAAARQADVLGVGQDEEDQVDPLQQNPRLRQPFEHH